jgi:hypothetical protein
MATIDTAIDTVIDTVIDTDTDIDNSWVAAYKASEENYNEFYNEKVTSIKVFSLYIDTTNTVVNMKQELCPLTMESTVSREQLIALIQAKQLTSHGIKYKLFSIVRYNIDLLPDEIPDFIKDSLNANTKRFLIPETYIRDIHFTDTISIFHDLNALYIIFKAVPLKQITANKFTQKLKASIKKRYTRHKKHFLKKNVAKKYF